MTFKEIEKQSFYFFAMHIIEFENGNFFSIIEDIADIYAEEEQAKDYIIETLINDFSDMLLYYAYDKINDIYISNDLELDFDMFSSLEIYKDIKNIIGKYTLDSNLEDYTKELEPLINKFKGVL